jgi:hypothetical protein
LRGEVVVRGLVSLILIGVFATSTPAEVSVEVYRADEKTPLALADPGIPGAFRDIMVGTRLVMFITSDVAGLWDGQLWLSPEAASLGVVSGRGYNPKSPSRNHEGSCLKAAGGNPLVNIHAGPDGVSVSLLSAWDAMAGEWFVLDYEARAAGTCHIELYTLGLSDEVVGTPNPYVDAPPTFELALTQSLTFNQVPSRDFDGSEIVDFADYALLATGLAEWGRADPNVSSRLDLNADFRVDILDVAAFSEYWLERTDVQGSGAEAVEP